MPYIKKDDRNKFHLAIYSTPPNNAGELNFLLTSICHEYVRHKGESYQTYNDIIGVLECAKLEMYRRQTAPYEGQKVKENGDLPSIKAPKPSV